MSRPCRQGQHRACDGVITPIYITIEGFLKVDVSWVFEGGCPDSAHCQEKNMPSTLCRYHSILTTIIE